MASLDDSLASRRTVLAALASLATLPGCASWFNRDIEPVCPESAEVSYPDGPLTIDAHCHVFNGSDLQVAKFLSMVAVKQKGALGEGANALGSILQELAWSFAPDGPTELAALGDLAVSLSSCTRPAAFGGIASLRQRGYATGRQQLQGALRRSAEFSPILEGLTSNSLPPVLDEAAKARVDAARIIETLPEDVTTYQSTVRLEGVETASLKSRSVQGMIDFVLQNFQYRYVTIHDYLHTYNQPRTRVVDLILPSLVDYDWWLAKGVTTPTPVPVQVDVMKQIAIVTRGRVHGFVPYDPLREVAYGLGYAPADSLGAVKLAINEQGCAGVKLYPPMGFAPLGNERVQRERGSAFWARSWLPPWMNRLDMGALLDQAMTKVLAWCEANQVPVMAHTNLSNGVTQQFEALAGAPYWELALQAFPNLRVNFGHFGDTALVEDGLTRARAFARLMNPPGNPGTFAYADAGYFVEVVGSEPAMLRNLRTIYDETAAKADAALANRFLYGTDWEMTLTEGPIASYLAQFVQLFDELETRPAIRAQGLTGLSAKFFGGNAVSFVGLRKGERTRARLDAFYAANGVPRPDWVKKVDAM